MTLVAGMLSTTSKPLGHQTSWLKFVSSHQRTSMHPTLGIGSPCSQPVRINTAGKASSTLQTITAMVHQKVLNVAGSHLHAWQAVIAVALSIHWGLLWRQRAASPSSEIHGCYVAKRSSALMAIPQLPQLSEEGPEALCLQTSKVNTLARKVEQTLFHLLCITPTAMLTSNICWFYLFLTASIMHQVHQALDVSFAYSILLNRPFPALAIIVLLQVMTWSGEIALWHNQHFW